MEYFFLSTSYFYFLMISLSIYSIRATVMSSSILPGSMKYSESELLGLLANAQLYQWAASPEEFIILRFPGQVGIKADPEADQSHWNNRVKRDR